MYVKTQWVDNTTPIDKNNLNKIEQGIYDNSLVVDAVTNTLNPTDTETYKTAELTEGQITDVIGVNDIVIKGQTSQDGTPTPSAPVDINVVSGSNVINTSNKNLFDVNKILQGDWNNPNSSTSLVLYLGKISEGDKFTASNYNSRRFAFIISNMPIQSNQASALQSSGNQTATRSTFTATANGYVFFKITKTDGGNITPNEINSDDFQIEKGSTATTYEPHQGKELPLDLPVENLFDGIFESGDINSSNGADESNNNKIRTKNYIKVPKNSSITMSILNQTAYSRLVFYDKNKNFISTIFNNNVPYTFTTGEASYIRFSVNTTNINIKAQIEQGSKANAYTPYGTEPIELCKIGNYQDYFYKSGSKWYLHKEIGKITLNGSENWQLANSGTSNYYYYYNLGHTTIQSSLIASTHYPYAFISNSSTEQGTLVLADGNIRIRYGTEDTVANFKTWLASNNVTLYYVLATATDTEITDTTLISQLEAIYNAPLYEETNITQTNNDLPMVLDITACKDNINGIKAFIRK